MSNYFPPDENEINAHPGQHNIEQDGEKPNEEESLVTEPEEEGMAMGTSYEEDKEQDLDDLIHSQSQLRKDSIPPPEDL